MAFIGDVTCDKIAPSHSLRLGCALLLAANLLVHPQYMVGQSTGAPAVKDALVDQSQGFVALGGERYMTVGGPQTLGGDTRSLIQFDFSHLPSTIAVSEATLYLYQVNAQSYRVTVHRVVEPWDENTATWAKRDGWAAWLNPAGGCTFDSTTVAGSFAANSVGWRAVPIDISLVQKWLNGDWPNYGLVLDAPGDQLFVPVKFETREARHRPQLHVRYTVTTQDSSGTQPTHD